MKTPSAKKLPSGQWFVRLRIDGRDIGITRHTEKEAVAEAMAIKAGIQQESMTPSRDKTVKKAMDEYISERDGILSPSTIRGYRQIQRNAFQSVMHTKIGDISDAKWQSLVNLEAKKHKAKTVKNNWGFMHSVIKNATGRSVEVHLPQLVPSERKFLDDDEILIFIEALKGTKVEIPALLALSSLRASEIKALRWKDVDLKNGVLHVNGATVPDEHGKYVRRTETKNTTSRRLVPIIPQLQAALEAVKDRTDLVVPTGHNKFYHRINAVCKKAGLPEVGVHGLRHSFASLMAYKGASKKETMEVGGWKREETVNKIYEHTYKKTKDNYGKTFTSFFTDKPPTPDDPKND